jgi:hypothetical protein
MGLFSRKRRMQGSSSGISLIDGTLPDGQWLAESESLYRDCLDDHYGSPETMAEGGRLHYGNQNFGVAMFFYAKSIDMLQTAYGFSGMRDRQPSAADAWIVKGFVDSLGVSVSMHPTAVPLECANQTAGLLRSIAGDCEAAGVPADIYLDGAAAIDYELA